MASLSPASSNAFEIAFDADDAGKRLDKALAEKLPEFSRGRLQGLIAAGEVMLNGAVTRDGAHKIRGGEHISLVLPPPLAANPVAQRIPLAILYEDDDLIVLDKAAGMVVHPSAGHETGTLVNALLGHCGARLSGINGVLRPGIVHRLDKDTSGVMVVAKSDRAHRGLAGQFADHGRTGPLEREYRAIIWGQLPRQHGVIETGIARSNQNREKMVVSNAARARSAITHYRLEEEAAFGGAVVASRIACQLETGRTHQIRVHLSHLGNPLLGDPLYGTGFRSKEKLLPEAARLALARLARQTLHARQLAFAHPVSGAVMRFETAPPADFTALEAALFSVL